LKESRFTADTPGRVAWHRLRTRARRLSTPPRLLAGSFLLLIAAGTLGLRTLPGLYSGDRLGWLDSLFTATSAVCVTGLIVVDTATYFTPAGQAYLLLLIQLGGLGILTLTSLVILALGGRPSLRHEAAASAGVDVAPQVDFRRLSRRIVSFTILFEIAGTLLLFAVWAPRFGPGKALWHAGFHSVSAFCNAGFSTFSDSLVGLSRDSWTLLVISGLVVVGGLGFLTMEEVDLWRRARRSSGVRRFRVSLHSRLVLSVTGILLLGGWIFFALFEWRNTLAGMPPPARVVNALFMSVTARTAGFNSVDYAQTAEASSFLTILLMAVGGSPGSTAGGLKTTTFALIALLAWSRWRGRRATSLWSRTIPEETTQRCVGLCVFAFSLMTVAIFVYTVTEIGVTGPAADGGFIHYMFETVSAFNTVGLSMGVTGDLSAPGRVLTILLMYLGRIGPLSFAAAIALHDDGRARRFRFARENVVIG